MIPFNKISADIDAAIAYIKDAAKRNKLCGDGYYTKKVSRLLQEQLNIERLMLTTSATSALEMAAMLSGVEEGDEIIMPSFTFVSTANAFLLHKKVNIRFVDINPKTMNIDEKLIEEAITQRTKVICPVHYAGVGCEMDTIMDIARKYNLIVVEDAAQAIYSYYKGKPLGGIGHFGCYSFHETKNYTMGEGGAICVNDSKYISDAEIIREKGTNRSQFFRGEIDKYSWIDVGASFLASEINVAYLLPQLEASTMINESRKKIWRMYNDRFTRLEKKGVIELLEVPECCEPNAHIYAIKVKDLTERGNILNYLKSNGIYATFHYVPLHSSLAGKKFGKFVGEDRYTTQESERLVRLPMYSDLTESEVEYIYEKVCGFWNIKA